MTNGTDPLAALVAALQRLPGIGARSAQRLAYHVLKTPREVYCAKRYVYENARKHLLPTHRGRPEAFSSGLWFQGWKDYVHDGWVSW